jgi:hypothetical protein
MFGSHSTLVAVSVTALAIWLTPSAAQAAPKHRRGARTAHVVSQHPCSKGPVDVVAGKESRTFALAKCDGTASPEGVDQISILARPSGVSRPKESLTALGKTHGAELAPGIRRVDPRLVENLELVVDQFRKPGQAERMVLAPLAPNASASQPSGGHRTTAKTMDFRIEGVTGEAIAAFCKTLPDAACGASPRGTFVRMEVRSSSTAHVVDADPSTQQPGSATTAPPSAEPRGKLAPLPDANRAAAASMVKPAEPEHFL